MALTGQPPKSLSLNQKLATVLGMMGMGILLLATFNVSFPNKTLWLTVSLLAISVGTIWFSGDAYSRKLPGIKNSLSGKISHSEVFEQRFFDNFSEVQVIHRLSLKICILHVCKGEKIQF